MKKVTFKFTDAHDKRRKKWNETSEANKIAKYLIANDADRYIYDIGANIFDHSIYFAKRLPNSQVYAFEPHPRYFDFGLKNVKDHNLKNVKGIMMGVGSKKEELSISTDNVASSFVENGSNNTKVEVDTLDNIIRLNKLMPPTFIKIDVEGFGAEVLKGAKDTIKKYKPLIMFEYHPHLPFVSKEMLLDKIKTLTDYGYRINKVINHVEFILSYSEDKSLLTLDEYFNKSKWNDEEFRKWWFKRKDASDLRDAYDVSTSKSERKSLVKKYKNIKKNTKIPFLEKMLWSKLYVFFTLKWLKG